MAKKYSFFGGVHPITGNHRDKALSAAKPVIPLKPPERIVIPLIQHLGSPAKPLVKAGDYVALGQKIAEASSFVSASVHASVSGTVEAVENRPHISGADVLSVIIKNDFSDTLSDEIKIPDVDALAPKDIIALIRDAGIVGMGGAAFPAHVKFTPPADKPIDTLILNAAECEPYLTTDHRLLLEHGEEIIKGLLLSSKAVGAKKIFIGIEDNKPDAIAAMEKLTQNNEITVAVLKTKYPQGAEKQIITSITGREVPKCALPFDIGVLAVNTATTYAIYRAVYLGLPLYERVVTVTGCVREPSNFLCRIGTPFSHLIEAAGGFLEPPAKLISGGPMMGVSFHSLDLVVMKATSGILALSEKEAKKAEESNCIRCGKCVEVCPIGLKPLYINAYAIRNDFETAEKYDALSCIECGCCSYICPAKRYLAESIRLAKNEINKRKKKGS